MSLPLLSLPYLVRKDVTKLFNLQERFLISILSKRAKTMMSLSKNQNLELKLDDDSFQVEDLNKDQVRIHLHNLNEESGGKRRWCCIVGQEWIATEIGMNNNITTYWRNKNTSFFKVLEHLLDVFHLSKTDLGFFNRDSDDYVRKLVGILKRRNVELMKVSVWNCPPVMSKSRDKTLLAIIEECSSAKKIEVACRTTADFKLSLKAPLEIEEVHIMHHNWLTKNSIIDFFMNCKSLAIDKCRFNNDKLRQIYLRWMKGSRLEYLSFSDFSVKSLPKVFADIQGSISVQRVRIHGEDNREFRYGQCYMINQATGKRAIVFNDDSKLTLLTDFKLVDREGRVEEDLIVLRM